MRIALPIVLILSGLVGAASWSAVSAAATPSSGTPVMQVVSTVAVGDWPWGVAFSPDDSLVYVGNSGSNTISVINVATGWTTTVSGGVLTGSAAAGVAVTPDGSKVLVTPFNYSEMLGLNAADLAVSNQLMGGIGCANPLPITMRDDGTAAYVGCGSGSILSVDPVTLVSTMVRNEAGQVADIAYVPQGASAGDDIAYIFNETSGINIGGYFRLSNAFTRYKLPGFGYSVAIDDSGSRAYVGDATGTLSVFSIATPTVVDDTLAVGGEPRAIALTRDAKYAFISDSFHNSVKLVDLVTLQVIDEVFVGSSPRGIALSHDERTVVVANNGTNTVTFINVTLSGVTPAFDAPVATTEGFDVNVTNYDPNFQWSASTSAGMVTLGSAVGTSIPVIVTGLTPGESAVVTVVATRTGYVTGSATVSGSALPSPPDPPAPPVQPGAPEDPEALPGDSSAMIWWSAPKSQGSFAITNYQVVVSPGGHACLTSGRELTCRVTGLVNGTPYTATVRALSGAGWSSPSRASSAFTPHAQTQPSIVVTGSRVGIGGRPGVMVRGASTGVDPGSVLRPWVKFRGQSAYTIGTAHILVDDSGEFSWQRRTGQHVSIEIRGADGAVTSNRLVLRAR